jgi:hypothetical protein
MLHVSWEYCRIDFWELDSPALEYGPVFTCVFGWFPINRSGRCSVFKVIIVRKHGWLCKDRPSHALTYSRIIPSCWKCKHLSFYFRCGSGSFVNMEHDSSRGRCPCSSCAASEVLSCTDFLRASGTSLSVKAAADADGSHRWDWTLPPPAMSSLPRASIELVSIHVVDDYGMSQVGFKNLVLSDQQTACSVYLC